MEAGKTPRQDNSARCLGFCLHPGLFGQVASLLRSSPDNIRNEEQAPESALKRPQLTGRAMGMLHQSDIAAEPERMLDGLLLVIRPRLIRQSRNQRKICS